MQLIYKENNHDAQWGFHKRKDEQSGREQVIHTNRNNSPDNIKSDQKDIRHYGCVFSKARSGFNTNKIKSTTTLQLDSGRYDDDSRDDFTSIKQLGDLKEALAEAAYVKANPFADQALGRNKTVLLVFFNNSLRTRLSTQKAALNLGMNPIVLDINQGAWKLETGRGVVMDGDKSEHILEAIPVMGSMCDMIGVRSFARFESRDDDYNEVILNQFIQYSGKPVFSMEAATRHPLQTFADIITIEEHKTQARPKVVMTWAPHPKALPQAVPNSFIEGMSMTDYDFVIANPEGYDLAPEFVGNAKVTHNQDEALAGADFVYAKNWAPYREDIYGKVVNYDMGWTVTAQKMALTNDAFFLHCLPVRRNMIVSDEVIEGPRSLVIPEAANRVVSAQTVLKRLLQAL